jgi:hypothetical protein
MILAEKSRCGNSLHNGPLLSRHFRATEHGSGLRTGLNQSGPTGDEALLAAAAQAVVAAFRENVQREQLPATSIAALRLLETALILYQDSRPSRR